MTAPDAGESGAPTASGGLSLVAEEHLAARGGFAVHGHPIRAGPLSAPDLHGGHAAHPGDLTHVQAVVRTQQQIQHLASSGGEQTVDRIDGHDPAFSKTLRSEK